MDAIKFCDKCHRLVYTVVHNGDKLELVQNRRVVLTTKVGSSINATLKCPGGHPMKVVIGKDGGNKEMAEGPDLKQENEERMAKMKAEMEERRKQLDAMMEEKKAEMTARREAMLKEMEAKKAEMEAQMAAKKAEMEAAFSKNRSGE